MSVSVDNQFAALASSPRDEGKDSSSRSMKDDVKESAWQAKNQLKAKAVELQEQVTSGINSGISMAKAKMGMADDASNEEVAAEAAELAQGEWETVQRKGKAAAKKAVNDAEAAVDSKLTPAQKAKLNKGMRQAKQAGKEGVRQAEGLVDSILSTVPQLRGVRSFIRRNNLQLPALIFMALGSLWLGLTLIRLITTLTTPKVPEFDIHSKEASMNWLKYHAGEYKSKGLDMKESLAGRVASFLANHEMDKIKAEAIDWKDIGMRKLGLAEPTYTEQLWAYVTGRPTTWQGRVESLLDLGKQGLKMSALKQGLKSGAGYLKGQAKDTLGLHEPTLLERATNYVTGHDASLSGRAQAKANEAASYGERVVDSIRDAIPGLKAKVIPEPSLVDNIKANIKDGINNVRSHLPGAADAEAARQAAYDATHHSTIDNIKSGAEYIKNRIVHGAEEAAHIAHDRANEAMDKAKYKTGL